MPINRRRPVMVKYGAVKAQSERSKLHREFDVSKSVKGVYFKMLVSLQKSDDVLDRAERTLHIPMSHAKSQESA